MFSRLSPAPKGNMGAPDPWDNKKLKTAKRPPEPFILKKTIGQERNWKPPRRFFTILYCHGTRLCPIF